MSCGHFSASEQRTKSATASRNLFNCAARCSGLLGRSRSDPSGISAGKSHLPCVASLEASGDPTMRPPSEKERTERKRRLTRGPNLARGLDQPRPAEAKEPLSHQCHATLGAMTMATARRQCEQQSTRASQMRRCASAFLAHSEVSASSDCRKFAAEVDGYGRIQRSEIGSYHFPIFIYDTPCLLAARPTRTRLTANQSRPSLQCAPTYECQPTYIGFRSCGTLASSCRPVPSHLSSRRVVPTWSSARRPSEQQVPCGSVPKPWQTVVGHSRRYGSRKRLRRWPPSTEQWQTVGSYALLRRCGAICCA